MGMFRKSYPGIESSSYKIKTEMTKRSRLKEKRSRHDPGSVRPMLLFVHHTMSKRFCFTSTLGTQLVYVENQERDQSVPYIN